MAGHCVPVIGMHIPSRVELYSVTPVHFKMRSPVVADAVTVPRIRFANLTSLAIAVSWISPKSISSISDNKLQASSRKPDVSVANKPF